MTIRLADHLQYRALLAKGLTAAEIEATILRSEAERQQAEQELEAARIAGVLAERAREVERTTESVLKASEQMDITLPTRTALAGIRDTTGRLTVEEARLRELVAQAAREQAELRASIQRLRAQSRALQMQLETTPAELRQVRRADIAQFGGRVCGWIAREGRP